MDFNTFLCNVDWTVIQVLTIIGAIFLVIFIALLIVSAWTKNLRHYGNIIAISLIMFSVSAFLFLIGAGIFDFQRVEQEYSGAKILNQKFEESGVKLRDEDLIEIVRNARLNKPDAPLEYKYDAIDKISNKPTTVAIIVNKDNYADVFVNRNETEGYELLTF